jgi:hypothetical protein
MHGVTPLPPLHVLDVCCVETYQGIINILYRSVKHCVIPSSLLACEVRYFYVRVFRDMTPCISIGTDVCGKHAMARCVETLRYKPEDPGLDYWRYHWDPILI